MDGFFQYQGRWAQARQARAGFSPARPSRSYGFARGIPGPARTPGLLSSAVRTVRRTRSLFGAPPPGAREEWFGSDCRRAWRRGRKPPQGRAARVAFPSGASREEEAFEGIWDSWYAGSVSDW